MDYDDQLDRAIEETPDVEDGGSRFEVPDPRLRKDGNFTVVENFPDIVERLGRPESHVLKHLQSELGTAAQLDKNDRARLTGEFRESRVADALSAYVDQFVLCPECGLPDTKLATESGAKMLRCEACGALSSTGE
jgi:translation initiation factor 2 subunit 2